MATPLPDAGAAAGGHAGSASGGDAGPAWRLGRQPALDGLRAIAVTMVFLGHVDDVLLPAGNDRIPAGFLGVDLFFVLSGFLVTALLLQELGESGRISVGRFLGRRAGRLFPALALLLAGHFLWLTFADTGVGPGDEAHVVPWVSLYLSNWANTFEIRWSFGLGHLWSLAIEGQFYVLWSLVLAVIVARRPKPAEAAVRIAAAGVTLIVVNRLLLLAVGLDWYAIYIRTDARLDSVLVGSLVAAAAHSGLLHRCSTDVVRTLAACATILLLLAAVLTEARDDWLVQGGYTAVALLSGAMVLGATSAGWWFTDLLSLPPLRFIGQVSYGIYLWHLPVMVAVLHLMPGQPHLLKVAVSILVTAMFVIFSWEFVEQPVLRWAARRWARPGSRVVAHDAPERASTAPISAVRRPTTGG